MQAGPFLLGVACRLAVQQIGHLAQVGFDIVEFILKPGTVEAEVNRIGPVALSDGPNMAAGSARKVLRVYRGSIAEPTPGASVLLPMLEILWRRINRREGSKNGSDALKLECRLSRPPKAEIDRRFAHVGSSQQQAFVDATTRRLPPR